MKNCDLMRQERGRKMDEATKMTAQAEKETRNLSHEEKAKFEILMKEIDNMSREIDNEERSQQLEMAAVTPGRNKIANPRNMNLGEEDRTFLRFVREGVGALDKAERRALTEDSTGQYLVSPGISDEMHRTIGELVPIRQLASKRNVTTDRVLVRTIEEATASWGKLETGSLITESDLDPTETTKYVEDIYSLVKVGEDELMDADYNLAAFLADSFGRSVAEKENAAFLAGRGHSYQEPDGICVDTTLLANGVEVGTSDTVVPDDCIDLLGSVPASARQGSAWIMNSITMALMMKAKATSSYLWQPNIVDATTPPKLLGFPVYACDQMDVAADNVGVPVVFGNFSLGYRILDRLNVTIKRLDELYAEAGIVGFLMHYRVGGYLIRPANGALALLKNKS